MKIKEAIATGTLGSILAVSLSNSLRGSVDKTEIRDITGTALISNTFNIPANKNYDLFSQRKRKAIEELDKRIATSPTSQIKQLIRKIDKDGLKYVSKSNFSRNVDSMAMFGLLTFILGLGFSDFFINKNKKSSK